MGYSVFRLLGISDHLLTSVKRSTMNAKVKTVTYKPFPTAAKFHASNAFVRGLIGPYGSGKSVACCMEIFSRAREQRKSPDGIRRTRWAIVRNSYGELRTTTQKTWTDWFPTSHFGDIKRGSGPDTHLLRFEDCELEVLFLALDREDDGKKLLSLELTGIWFNEGREISWPIVEKSLARVGRYPARRDGGPTWHGVIMDTNPPSVRSWWYRMFEVNKPKNWEIFHQPSGVSKQAENIINLPAHYYENMSAGMDELSIRANVHGEYSFSRSGQPVFPAFKFSLHVSDDPLHPIPGNPIFVGIDVGRSPGVIFAQEQYGGRIHILSEITGSDMPAIQLAEQIKRHVAQHYEMCQIEYYADPAFTHMSQTRDESVADVLFNAGLNVYPASTNSIDLRLEAVRTLLSQLDPTGEPMMIVSPACEVLIEALVGGYHFKEEATGGGHFKDKPEKNQYSHVADALQYCLLGAGCDPRYSGTPGPVVMPKVVGRMDSF